MIWASLIDATLIYAPHLSTVMRSALLFVALLLFAIVPFSNTSAEDHSDESFYTINASFDNSTEMTTLNITMPVTNNATKLDLIKDANFTIRADRYDGVGQYMGDVHIGTYQFCTQGFSNSECSGAHFEIEYYPTLSSQMQYRLLINHPTIFQGAPTIMALSDLILQNVNPVLAVENLSASYSDGITDLTWDYPTGLDMNHSIMVYSHDSPATRENWNGMSKTIVSSSVPAGTTNFQINHADNSVEREIYYSVTLLYPTSEDTRFLGSNTLTSSVWEDNTAPLFIGELTATFDPISDTTTIDWGAGVDDEDLVINIYRSDKELDMVDSSGFIGSVDASQSSAVVQVPFGEHRQSWYSITLQDSAGNEILELTQASPVSEQVIESTIDITTVTNLGAERYGDGTIVVTWDDETGNQEAVARVWRSFTGPITSLQNVEELVSVNLSNEQASHKPLNPEDEAWYAVTLDAAWGSGQDVWHDETLVLGLNSLSNPIRETAEVVQEVEITFSAQLITTSGIRENITDGAMISLGEMDQNDILVISTSYPVESISCYGIAGDNTSIHAEMDWALTFNANQSGEECGGLISNGDQEITFILSWTYVETVYEANNTRNTAEVGDEKDDHGKVATKVKESSDVVAVTILSILILSLLIYLSVMMKKQDYSEEE
mgnify:CR=1 FL=1